MRIFILVVLGFCLICGLLVVESGLFSKAASRGTPKGCILLQQTTGGQEPKNAGLPVSGGQSLESADLADLSATGGPQESIILGAEYPDTEDPKAGYKFQLQLNTRGAAIEKATFSNGDDKGFDDRDHEDPQPLVILSPVDRDVMSMAVREFVLVDHKRQLRLDQLSWKIVSTEKGYGGSSRQAQFKAVISGASGEPLIRLVKTYTVHIGSYLVDCSIKVENLSNSQQKVRFNLTGPVGIGREGIRSDERKVVGGFSSDSQIVSCRKEIRSTFLSRKAGLKDATLAREQALKTHDQARLEQAEEDLRIGNNLPDKLSGAHFLWAATTNKYFAALLRPVPDEDQEYCGWVADKTARFYNPDADQQADSGDETISLALKIAPVVLAASGGYDSSRTYNFQLYLGPKDRSLFNKNDLYRNAGFLHTITFSPCCCCPSALINPIAFGILWLMKQMYGFIGNYGIVIIILVFVFRIAIHPLTKKSQVSMSKLQKIANSPEVQQMKKKYAGNMAEQQKQMMAVYKKHGVSPASQVTAMLPMMVQMPIWIALWSAINASIDLRGAAFLPFWITDLSVPDALFRFSQITVPLLRWKIDSFNLLPILMGVAFYLQQKLMPAQAAAAANPQAAQQQKMMQIMMIVMFPLMLYKGPSGVNLYIMSSVFAGVFEQYFIKKHIREKEEAESTGLVAATSKTGGKVKKKKPKPFYRNH
jgi:YidC/Oxa1 family membrane protein insertase